MCRKLSYSIYFVLALGLILTSAADAELVGWWKLDDGSGTTAADSSGNGNDGTLQGGAQWGVGKFVMAAEFDGVDDFVEVPHSEILTVDNEVTVMAWIHTSRHGGPGPEGYQGIIAKSNGPRSYSLYTQNNTFLHFSTAGIGSNSSTAVPLNEWAHVAAVVGGGEHFYYINGEPAGTGGGGVTLPGAADTGTVVIGRTNEGANRSFLGRIDDARVYNHALSQDEILASMVSEGQPSAFGPDPADGAIHAATWVNLSWLSGESATSHDVYLGDDFDAVNDATTDSPEFRGNQPLDVSSIIAGFIGFPYPDGLVPGTTYYWPIDEIKPDDPDSPWKGDVWSFWVPPQKAYDADPAEGVGVVQTDATVSWTAGFGAIIGQMYFGTDAAEVEAGTGDTSKGTVVGTTYDPGPLEEGTTYYWRVDQFDGAVTHKGDVWSLTTVPIVPVSDPDLKAWWTMEQGAGTVVVDQSGNGNHGSFVGPIEWADGYQGMALEFAGGSSGSPTYVDFGNPDSLQLADSVTMSAWVKMNASNAGVYMGIGGKLISGEYKGFALVRHSSNVFRLWCDDGAAALAGHEASSNGTYTDTEWHHVAGVVDLVVSSLYVDGVKQTQQGSVDLTDSGGIAYIGKQYGDNSSHRYWNGLIDDVRIYNKALTDAQIAEVMLGNKKLAGSPSPSSGSIVDIRDISSLSFSAGDGAASHDVYLGTDRGAVVGADNSAPEFQGNQAGTSLSVASLVEFGNDYYWRVDEVAADGTVTAGTIWNFMVPGSLIIDNFESYNDIDPPGEGSNRIFDSWIDGFGTTTNGALVGNDLPPYAERTVVQDGAQAMIYAYDNAGKTSEATLTVARRDWTAMGVTKLSLWIRGSSANAADRVYVALNGTAVIYHDDPAATQITRWTEWVIDLSAFGVDLTNVNSISIGVGTKNAPAADGGTGTMHFDGIGLIL